MRCFFSLLLLCSTTLVAQFNESFSDGEILNNPQWFGNIDSFLVNNDFQLQLDGRGAGVSFIFVKSEVIEEANWRFFTKTDFNPSSSNNTRVFLAMDIEDPDLVQNAVWLDIGSNEDRIELLAYENGKTIKLIQSESGLLNLSGTEIEIEVKRDNNTWQLSYNVGAGWQLVDENVYETQFASKAFGISCTYTKTRKDKFYFDNINVHGLAYIDAYAPELVDCKLQSGEHILLSFNEALDEESIQNEDFYLKQLKRIPSSTEYNSDENSLLLYFNPALNDINSDTLTVSDLTDLAGNVINSSEAYIQYERVKVETAKLLDIRHLSFRFSRAIPRHSWDSAVLHVDNSVLNYTLKDVSEDEQAHNIALEEDFVEGQKYELMLSHLKDDRGDSIRTFQSTVFFYQTKRYDLVFNELMVDPSPPIALPEYEYIELYNRSEFDIDLEAYVLEVNKKLIELPQGVLKSYEYCVLIPQNSIPEWHGNFIPLSTWYALGNEGFRLVLRDKSRKIIDAYQYYRGNVPGELFKKEGGWSVERVDVNNQSGDLDNWLYSMDLKGGTPIADNSVKAIRIDEQRPGIEYIELLDDTALHIAFNETMYLDEKEWSYEISPDIYETDIEKIDSVFYSGFTIDLNNGLDRHTSYELYLEGFNDWAGNALLTDRILTFASPDSLETGDVLINEVLFNPLPEGVDFVELINASSKVISIKDLFLAQVNDDGSVQQLYELCDRKRLLFPNDYLLLSTDSLLVQSQYNCKNPNFFLNVKKMPSMPNDEGAVFLCDKYGNCIDQMNYSDNMHFDLIKDTEGVSLERLSVNKISFDVSNWHSAASDIGYASPSYKNSQSVEDVVVHGVFELDNDVFSPNGDGTDDQLILRYKNEETGGSVSIRVYDSSGNEIKCLINTQLMSSEGFFTWNGLGEQGQQLMPGIYLLWIQCHYPSGKVLREKKVCVISPGEY